MKKTMMQTASQHKTLLPTILAAAILSVSGQAAAAESVFVGHLADMSGPTAFIGKVYANGVRDSLAYINANGDPR